MKFQHWILAIALLFLFTLASAREYYIGYSNDNVNFEIYYNNSYRHVNLYSDLPYTTVSGTNYYYFDYPARVSYYNDYQYFNPGWYSFGDGYWKVAPHYQYDSYWTVAPDTYFYYNYYPSSYYYYDNSWAYYPNWTTVYGPRYYSYTYFQSAPTITGQHYHPEQTADCSELGLSGSDVTVSGGNTRTATVTLNNYANSFFDVSNVQVYTDSVDLSAENVSFDKTISDYSSEKISFTIRARADSLDDYATAKVKVYGTFRDGTYCSGSIEKTINVNVNSTKPKKPVDEALYGSGAYYKAGGSTSYTVAKETQQSWEDVQPAKPSVVYSQPQETERDSNPDHGTTVTYYDKRQITAYDCTGLSINAENLVVESGESRTAYFTAKNYSSEDFYIDSVEAIEYGTDFSASASSNGMLYSGSTSTIKVKVSAFTTEKDSTGTGYLQVKGHYKSGTQCSFASETFYVKVNGEQKEDSIRLVKVENPSMVEFSGTSGFVEFSVDNPSDEQIKVKVYSSNANVSPKEFLINPKSFGTRVVAFNNAEEEAAIFFEAESDSAEYLQKYTKAVRVASQPVVEQQEPEEYDAQIPVDNVQNQEPEQESLADGFNNFMSAGFAFLADNTIGLGLVALVLIIGFLVLPRN